MMTKLTVTVLKGVLKVMKLSLIAIIMENIWIMEVKMKMSMKFMTKKKKVIQPRSFSIHFLIIENENSTHSSVLKLFRASQLK